MLSLAKQFDYPNGKTSEEKKYENNIILKMENISDKEKVLLCKTTEINLDELGFSKSIETQTDLLLFPLKFDSILKNNSIIEDLLEEFNYKQGLVNNNNNIDNNNNDKIRNSNHDRKSFIKYLSKGSKRFTNSEINNSNKQSLIHKDSLNELKIRFKQISTEEKSPHTTKKNLLMRTDSLKSPLSSRLARKDSVKSPLSSLLMRKDSQINSPVLIKKDSVIKVYLIFF